MELPTKTPLVENAVVMSKIDLANLIQKALARERGGVFLKIFSKDAENKYYITLLLDSSKVLAAEGIVVDTKEKYGGGDKTLELFRALLGKPMIVDVYSLDEIELKLAIAENLEAYSETPKVPPLGELFGGGR